MRTVSGYVDRIESNVIIVISEEENKEFILEKKDKKMNFKEKDWVLISLNAIDDIIKVVKVQKVTKQRTEKLRVLKNKLKRRD